MTGSLSRHQGEHSPIADQGKLMKNKLLKIKFPNPTKNVIMLVSALVGVAISVVSVKATQVFFSRALGNTPTLKLPSSVVVNPNSSFSVPIELNTDGVNVVGVDVSLSFDPTKISLESISPLASSTNFKHFGPLDESGNFNSSGVVSTANATGKIEFSAATVDMGAQQFLSPYTGTTLLALLNFKALGAGQTQVSFNIVPNGTTDTNVVANTNPPQDKITDQSQVVNLTISVASPSPSPTLAPTARPTSSPSPSASSSPSLQTVALDASIDTYVNAASSGTSYGSEKLVYVDSSPNMTAYLLFDLSGLATQTLSSAKLSFMTTSGSYSGSPNEVEVYLVENTSWQENISYANRPTVSSVFLGKVLASQSNTVYELNLSLSSVQQRLGNKFAIAIVPTGGDALYFNSREANIYAPKLILGMSGAVLPSVSGSSVKIYAAGSAADGIYPTMDLLIKDKIVATFKDVSGNIGTRQFLTFEYNSLEKVTSSDVKVRFTNDLRNYTGDRNLVVDKISVDGIDFQSESSNVYGTGVWTSNIGCTEGNLQTEWLYCNGYFKY